LSSCTINRIGPCRSAGWGWQSAARRLDGASSVLGGAGTLPALRAGCPRGPAGGWQQQRAPPSQQSGIMGQTCALPARLATDTNAVLSPAHGIPVFPEKRSEEWRRAV